MHRNVVIICNGEFPKTEYPLYLVASADILVCCDGAFEKYLSEMEGIFHRKRLPEVVIGDLDSLPEKLRMEYEDIIVKVDEQEYNDQTKAFRWVMDNVGGPCSISIIGATGLREDHTIGNVSLLMEYARMYDLESLGADVRIVSDYGTIFAITDTFEMECGPGRRVSIFSPDNSLNIKSTGLEYKTDGVVFDNWWKATLNKSTQDKVRLEFSHKSIALIMLD